MPRRAIPVVRGYVNEVRTPLAPPKRERADRFTTRRDRGRAGTDAQLRVRGSSVSEESGRGRPAKLFDSPSTLVRFRTSAPPRAPLGRGMFPGPLEVSGPRGWAPRGGRRTLLVTATFRDRIALDISGLCPEFQLSIPAFDLSSGLPPATTSPQTEGYFAQRVPDARRLSSLRCALQVRSSALRDQSAVI